MVEGVATPAPSDDEVLTSRIDELVPPPMSGDRWALAVVAILVLCAAALQGPSMVADWRRLDFDADKPSMRLDEQRGLIRLSGQLSADRTFTLTDLTVDAPGTRLVEFTTPGPAIGADQQLVFPQVVELDESDAIRPRAYLNYSIWLEPTSCVDPAPPWGSVSATFEMGGEHHTVTSRSFWTGSRYPHDPLDNNHGVLADGPLELACEVLR